MRHQFYSNARDVAKWTTLVRIAKQQSREIVQIAMLTRDGATDYGRMRDDPPDADPIVVAFFDAERQLIMEDPSRRRIERIVGLGERFEPPLAIEVISDPFENRNRRQYFNSVCHRISRIGQHVVAFADPDTGIAIGRPSLEHNARDELRIIWSALNPGSVLTVFQYQQRLKGWIDSSRDRFASALNIEPTMVDVVRYAHVSFLSALRS